MKQIEPNCRVVVTGGDRADLLGCDGIVFEYVNVDEVLETQTGRGYISGMDGWLVNFDAEWKIFTPSQIVRIDDYEEPETQKEEELLEA